MYLLYAFVLRIRENIKRKLLKPQLFSLNWSMPFSLLGASLLNRLQLRPGGPYAQHNLRTYLSSTKSYFGFRFSSVKPSVQADTRMDSRLRGKDKGRGNDGGGAGTHAMIQGWIPAFAGMTESTGMTEACGNDGGDAGMTEGTVLLAPALLALQCTWR